jgi:hypothetical protein
VGTVTYTLDVLLSVQRSALRFGLPPDKAAQAARAAVGLYRQDGNRLRALNDGRALAQVMARHNHSPKPAA